MAPIQGLFSGRTERIRQERFAWRSSPRRHPYGCYRFRGLSRHRMEPHRMEKKRIQQSMRERTGGLDRDAPAMGEIRAVTATLTRPALWARSPLSRTAAEPSGEWQTGVRVRSCATRKDPRGRAWPGHPGLRCGGCGRVEARMPGTCPGKGLLGARFGAKPSPERLFNFPRTALRIAGVGASPRITVWRDAGEGAAGRRRQPRGPDYSLTRFSGYR